MNQTLWTEHLTLVLEFLLDANQQLSTDLKTNQISNYTSSLSQKSTSLLKSALKQPMKDSIDYLLEIQLSATKQQSYDSAQPK